MLVFVSHAHLTFSLTHENMRNAIQYEGLIFLRMILLGTSRSVYGTKNIVTAVLYCRLLAGILRSVVMPAVFALPTF